jgi:hypothetical protein
MPKTRERDKIEVVAINPTGTKDTDGDDLEEVFLYREEPYLNEARYAKAGTYKLGAYTEGTIHKKESEEG